MWSSGGRGVTHGDWGGSKRPHEGVGDSGSATGKRQRSEVPLSVFGGPANVVERITDEHKLSQRQKQIDFGKNTIGYERYSRQVRRHERRPGDPRTPDIREPHSKRQFDGLVKEWRRRLHQWEGENPPPSVVSSSNSCPGSALPLEPTSQAMTASYEAEVEAEADALLKAASNGLMGGMDLDSYLDGALDEDEGDEEEGSMLPTRAVMPPPTVVGGQRKTPTSDTADLATKANQLAPHPAGSKPTLQPARSQVATIFRDASTIDDGLVG